MDTLNVRLGDVSNTLPVRLLNPWTSGGGADRRLEGRRAHQLTRLLPIVSCLVFRCTVKYLFRLSGSFLDKQKRTGNFFSESLSVEFKNLAGSQNKEALVSRSPVCGCGMVFQSKYY
jgi:hypothetical protein